MLVVKYRFLALFIVVLTAMSCSKSDSFLSQNDLEAKFSSVAVFNAIPNSTSVSIGINHGNSNYSTVTAGDNLFFGRYLKYRNWFSGSFNMFIENNTGNVKEIANDKVSFRPGQAYSLFLYNNGVIKSLLSEDNIISPVDGKAKVRIAHLCTNLPNVNLYNDLNNDILFKDIKFGSVSDYIEVNVGARYSFLIETLDKSVELTSSNTVLLDNKGVYTILLKGAIELASNNEDVGFVVIKQ